MADAELGIAVSVSGARDLDTLNAKLKETAAAGKQTNAALNNLGSGAVGPAVGQATQQVANLEKATTATGQSMGLFQRAAQSIGNFFGGYGRTAEGASISLNHLAGAHGSVTRAMHLMNAVAYSAGSSIAGVGQFAMLARGGLAILAAGITATVIVSLENAADKIDKVKAKLQGLLGASQGGQAFKELKTATDGAHNSLDAYSQGVGRLERELQRTNSSIKTIEAAPDGSGWVVYNGLARVAGTSIEAAAGAMSKLIQVDKETGTTAGKMVNEYTSAMAKVGGLTLDIFTKIEDEAPTLARAIAAGLNLSGLDDVEKRLRDRSISIDRVIVAIQNGSKKYQSAIENMQKQPNLSQSWDRLKTSIENAWAELGKGVGIGSRVFSSIASGFEKAIQAGGRAGRPPQLDGGAGGGAFGGTTDELNKIWGAANATTNATVNSGKEITGAINILTGTVRDKRDGTMGAVGKGAIQATNMGGTGGNLNYSQQYGYYSERDMGVLGNIKFGSNLIADPTGWGPKVSAGVTSQSADMSGAASGIARVDGAIQTLGTSATNAATPVQGLGDAMDAWDISGTVEEFNTFGSAIESLSSRISSAIDSINSAGGKLGSGGGPSFNMSEFASTGYATGGAFTVGGVGGTDTTPVSFMATPGEIVTITPKGDVPVGMRGATSATLQQAGGENNIQSTAAPVKAFTNPITFALKDATGQIVGSVDKATNAIRSVGNSSSSGASGGGQRGGSYRGGPAGSVGNPLGGLNDAYGNAVNSDQESYVSMIQTINGSKRLIYSINPNYAGGFATGGFIDVGNLDSSGFVGGAGGQDSKRISLDATPGERITVSRPGRAIGKAQPININIYGANSPQAFIAAESQIKRSVRRAFG